MARQTPQSFRIISGNWRGRRLGFPALGDIRPSPDRVRETLFNWLAPTIPCSRCLDLFAGSGALGLEALSRGATACLFVDRNRQALVAIASHLQTLDSQAGQVQQHDALGLLANPPAEKPFDVVFLDPPFAAGLAPQTMALLTQNNWLAPGARVYLELPAKDGSDALAHLPPGWRVDRQQSAGAVRYHLLTTD